MVALIPIPTLKPVLFVTAKSMLKPKCLDTGKTKVIYLLLLVEPMAQPARGACGAGRAVDRTPHICAVHRGMRSIYRTLRKPE